MASLPPLVAVGVFIFWLLSSPPLGFRECVGAPHARVQEEGTVLSQLEDASSPRPLWAELIEVFGRRFTQVSSVSFSKSSLLPRNAGTTVVAGP